MIYISLSGLDFEISKVVLKEQRASNDAKGISKNINIAPSEKKRCGTRHTCKMSMHVFIIIFGVVSRHNKNDTYLKKKGTLIPLVLHI